MAQIFLNSFGQIGTLAIWSFVILGQWVFASLAQPSYAYPARYMMGSSVVSLSLVFAYVFGTLIPYSRCLLLRVNPLRSLVMVHFPCQAYYTA